MKRAVILIPGLSDGKRGLALATRNWMQRYGILPLIIPMQWKNKEESYEDKLVRILDQIDKLHIKEYKVLLLGTSAGGCAAINTFCKRKNKISKVVNVCGRLRKGEKVFPSLDIAARASPSFKQSILECEENIKSLSDEDRKKIFTIRSLFDEIVPTTLVSVPGATNTRIVSIGHVVSITLVMMVYWGKIIDFLLKE
jgi:hypothetical protein